MTASRRRTCGRCSRSRTPPVEAGLGTLGLNLQLLTPEFGPRVLLTAILCSLEVACDQKMQAALCLGPSCGRCLKTCPADAVGHWSAQLAGLRSLPLAARLRPIERARYPHHFRTGHGAAERTRSLGEDSFNLWQSILRGAGVITGCRRCADVCPVGADYAAMLSDALDDIPENTPAKEARAAEMDAQEKAGSLPETYAGQVSRGVGLCRHAAPDPMTPLAELPKSRIEIKGVQSARRKRAVEQARRAPFYKGRLDGVKLGSP